MNNFVEKSHSGSNKFPYYCINHRCYCDKPICRYCSSEAAQKNAHADAGKYANLQSDSNADNQSTSQAVA